MKEAPTARGKNDGIEFVRSHGPRDKFLYVDSHVMSFDQSQLTNSEILRGMGTMREWRNPSLVGLLKKDIAKRKPA